MVNVVGYTAKDLLLARSDKLVRWGAVVPFGGLCLVAVSARLVNLTRNGFVIEMLCLSAVGQILVWSGMCGLRRVRGWESGVFFYIAFGGLTNALAVASTGILYLTPIPLIAPATAWVARARLRRGREERGAR